MRSKPTPEAVVDFIKKVDSSRVHVIELNNGVKHPSTEN